MNFSKLYYHLVLLSICIILFSFNIFATREFLFNFEQEVDYIIHDLDNIEDEGDLTKQVEVGKTWEFLLNPQNFATFNCPEQIQHNSPEKEIKTTRKRWNQEEVNCLKDILEDYKKREVKPSYKDITNSLNKEKYCRKIGAVKSKIQQTPDLKKIYDRIKKNVKKLHSTYSDGFINKKEKQSNIRIDAQHRPSKKKRKRVPKNKRTSVRPRKIKCLSIKWNRSLTKDLKETIEKLKENPAKNTVSISSSEIRKDFIKKHPELSHIKTSCIAEKLSSSPNLNKLRILQPRTHKKRQFFSPGEKGFLMPYKTAIKNKTMRRRKLQRFFEKKFPNRMMDRSAFNKKIRELYGINSLKNKKRKVRSKSSRPKKKLRKKFTETQEQFIKEKIENSEWITKADLKRRFEKKHPENKMSRPTFVKYLNSIFSKNPEYENKLLSQKNKKPRVKKKKTETHIE